MFSSSFRGNGGGNEREALLAAAKKEREIRAKLSVAAKPALKLQAFARGLLERARVRKMLDAELSTKLDGLQKLAAVMLKAKGIDFVPPAEGTLRPLIARFDLVFRNAARTPLSVGELAVISSFHSLIKKSLASPDRAANVKEALPRETARLIETFFRLVCRPELPGSLRVGLVETVSSFAPNSTPIQHARGDLSSSIERLLSSAAPDATLNRIQRQSLMQPEAFVSLALERAQESLGASASTELCATLFSCPFLFERLALEGEHCTARGQRLRIKTSDESAGPILVPLWELLIRQLLRMLLGNRAMLEAKFQAYLKSCSVTTAKDGKAKTPLSAAGTSLATPSAATAPASGAFPLSQTPLAPAPALTSTFGMFGLKASATGKVGIADTGSTAATSVPAAGAGAANGAGSASAPASTVATPAPTPQSATLMPTPPPQKLPIAIIEQMKAWPLEAYVLGNLVQLLSSSTSPATATKAHQHRHPFVSCLSRDALIDAIRIILLCRDSIPSSVWHTALPLIWPPGSSSPSSASASGPGSSSAVPAVMPPLLIAQLRTLSREALAKSLAKRCCWVEPSLLRSSGMRLSDTDDPEAGTYDQHHIDLTGAATATAHQGRGASSLSAAPSAATSLLRGGLSLLRRLAGSVGGSKASSSASPAVTPQSIFAPPASSTSAAAIATATAAADRKGKKPKKHNPFGGAEASDQPFDRELFELFVTLYAPLLLPRPPHAQATSAATGGSSLDADPVFGRLYVLNALVYSPSLAMIRSLWAFCGELAGVDQTTVFRDLVVKRAFKSTWLSPPSGSDGTLSLLEAAVSVLASCLAHLLPVCDDAEIHTSAIFPLRELRVAVRLLRDIVAHTEGVGVDDDSSGETRRKLNAPPSEGWTRFSGSALSCLRMLWDRHCVRPLGPQSMWLIDCSKVALTMPAHATASGSGASGGKLSDYDAAINALLRVMPFAVPFETRAAMFEATRQEALARSQRGMPQVPLYVSRDRLFETAYAGLKGVSGETFRRKVAVRFEGEAGLDAGGLFKDLLTSLSDIVFDPAYGLFRTTPEHGELYPNPSSNLCAGLDAGEGDDAVIFEFVGRVIGKALFEGITIGPQFARFFLHRLLGRTLNIHYLPSLDPELYKSLIFLKAYEGDVENDLSLTFTAAADDVGGGVEIELVPGGRNIAVTSKNRLQYIDLVTKWRLDLSMKRQTDSFRKGLMDVLPSYNWLTPFSAPELQVLISGSQRGIDIEDLKSHCGYQGGYWVQDATIRAFWDVVGEFNEQDKRALLRFVTAAERPPPNGFSQLYPQFTIAKLDRPSGAAGGAGGGSMEHLPQASTCFNVLKLPAYGGDKKKLKDKLLAAIHSGTGFELT